MGNPDGIGVQGGEPQLEVGGVGEGKIQACF